MIDARSYSITIRKTVIDGESFFEATVGELPDLTEYGESYQEAYDLAIDAIETVAEMFASAGRVFPSSRACPRECSSWVACPDPWPSCRARP